MAIMRGLCSNDNNGNPPGGETEAERFTPQRGREVAESELEPRPFATWLPGHTTSERV